MNEPTDPRVAAGILTAERAELLRLERDNQQLKMELARAEQRRAKANGHIQAARQRIGVLTREVGQKLRQLGVDIGEAARLSMPLGGALAELTLAAEETRPETTHQVRPVGKVIDLGARVKR